MSVTIALNAPAHAVARTLSDTNQLRHMYRVALENETTREGIADMYVALSLDMIEHSAGRHSVEWRSLASAFDAVSAQHDIEAIESYRVSLAKPVSLAKRIHPCADVRVRSGLHKR